MLAKGNTNEITERICEVDVLSDAVGVPCLRSSRRGQPVRAGGCCISRRMNFAIAEGADETIQQTRVANANVLFVRGGTGETEGGALDLAQDVPLFLRRDSGDEHGLEQEHSRVRPI